MKNLKVSENKEYFSDHGRPVFMLADTAWAAFSRATKEEWKQYLELRKTQGFNSVQFSMLPIVSDCSRGKNDRFPFIQTADGAYDFDLLNEAYFNFAEELIKMTVEAGMAPVITLLWVTYINGSWANSQCPGYALSWKQCERYLDYVLKRFKQYNPLYYVSGDAKLDEETLDLEIYHKALEKVKELAPEALVSMHIASQQAYYPDAYKKEFGLDFYTYQAGHPYDNEGTGYELAQEELLFPQKPVWSNEVCYEGHAKTGGHLKHSAYDVRRASWQSYFGGAKVGISYGAHGLWSWHKKEDTFSSEPWSGSMEPWYKALQYPGAWDMTYMQWLCLHYGLYEFTPYKLQLIEEKMHDVTGICAMQAKDGNQLAIYAPYPISIYLQEDITAYNWEAFDLEKKCPFVPEAEKREAGSLLRMVSGKEDILYIGLKKK